MRHGYDRPLISVDRSLYSLTGDFVVCIKVASFSPGTIILDSHADKQIVSLDSRLGDPQRFKLLQDIQGRRI